MSCMLIWRAQNRGRVNRSHHQGRQLELQKLTAMLGDPEIAAKQRLGRSGSQADDDLRLPEGDFRIQPRTAGGNLSGIGLFVDAALAAGFPLEVFHGIRDIGFAAVDARFDHGMIEDSAGRADKGLARKILLMAGLFTHKHDFRVRRTAAENGLRPPFPKVAGSTVLRGFS